MFRPIRLDHTNCLQVAIKTHSFCVAEPVGSVLAEDLESMYIQSLSDSFSSRLLDLHTIGGTLSQIVPGGARTTDSDGGLSVGLQLLQQYVVKLDNDQIIVSEHCLLVTVPTSYIRYRSSTKIAFCQASRS